MGEVLVWLVLLVVGLGLALVLLVAAFYGAVLMLAFALEQGFLGLAAYIALWVFLFPVMLVLSIILGALLMKNAPSGSA